MKYKNHIEHYKIDAEAYDFFNVDKFSVQEHLRRYQSIFNLLKIKNNGNEKILEIGSGGGHALEHINSNQYFPLDVSSYNLKKIRKKSTKEIFPVSGDIFRLPFSSNKFDAIILSEVLEHLDKPQNALQEIYRVLKPSGLFVVSVPYKEVLTYQICIHCNKQTPTNAHVNSFDKNTLEAMLNSVNFSVLKSTKCLNKISNRLHINIFLEKLPFKYWEIIDNLFTYFADKPASIIFLCKKNSE